MRRFAVLALGALVLTGCNVTTQREQAQASGQQSQRDFPAGEFRAVALQGIFNVAVTVGGSPSVRAEGDSAALEGVEIRVEDGRLIVGTKRGWSWNGRGDAVTVRVTVPALEAADITGTGDLTIDRVETQRFTASISGTGDMTIGALQARQAEFSITGTGDLTARGRADDAELSITGAGSLDLEGFEVARADISLVGAGDIELRARETVSGSVMGPGDITISGGARCSISKVGPGEVRCN